MDPKSERERKRRERKERSEKSERKERERKRKEEIEQINTRWCNDANSGEEMKKKDFECEHFSTDFFRRTE